MSSVTLAEAKKLTQDDLVRGIVETIISVDPFYDVLPFESFKGQAVLVNQETTAGDAGNYAVDATITHKTPAGYTQKTFSAVTLLGDVELNGLVRATSGSDSVDLLAIEVASKSRSIGRLFRQGMATGTGVAPQMNSLHTLCDSSQYTKASTGQALSFELLDELCSLVTAKDGQVDFIMMAPRTFRKYKTLLRAQGGTSADWIVNLNGGRTTIAYEGIPVFSNPNLSVEETANGAALTGGNLTSVWAGCLDDGTRRVGVAGIYPASVPAGVQVEEVGAAESKDNRIFRVKQYTNFVCFSPRGLARLTSISD